MKKTSLCILAAVGVMASGCVAVPYDNGPHYDNRPVYREAHPPRAHGDRDHDGIPNRYDRDRDGDGVPNRVDRQPNNPYRN